MVYETLIIAKTTVLLQCHPEPSFLLLLGMRVYINFHYSWMSHLSREITPAWKNSRKCLVNWVICAKRQVCPSPQGKHTCIGFMESPYGYSCLTNCTSLLWMSLKAFLCWALRTVLLTPSSFGGSRAPSHTNTRSTPTPQRGENAAADCSEGKYWEASRPFLSCYLPSAFSAFLGCNWEVHYIWCAFSLSA